MTKDKFIQFIKDADFRTLFNEMGWDRPSHRDSIPPLTIDGIDYQPLPVAQKRGLHVFSCAVSDMPQHALRRKLDVKLRKYANDYILIFTIIGKAGHHLWMVPVKNTEKRDIVVIEYETPAKADFLHGKVQDISFDLLKVVTTSDVIEKVRRVFSVNAAEVTKKFYTDFKKQHTAFSDFISGIGSVEDRQWYTSVMLNRLMFCYFVQKKGFLNFDTNYLRNKLDETQRNKGENKFYETFYKGFLKAFFHEGLNAPKRTKAFEAKYGRIPYLNGGIFDYHELETLHPNIDIPDDAFIKLFDFFDDWRWHLDTNITASGKDINPDVLGYIFEQYINDRAKMGAYYTKEDITDYIGKNSLIPFLMETVAQTDSKSHFHPTKGFIWKKLKGSGDKYIYPAIRKGMNLSLPPDIERGIDTQTPNLLERRAGWNAQTPADYALPTEIWRETIARRQRCQELCKKIKAGEITHINDFITCNLDIRQFMQDVLAEIDDHKFILHFYQALRKVTILDPTCGSGAFLFAALNILEPLYEICIERMQAFHASDKRFFKKELEELDSKCRSNIQYFIYKSIILRNLYGVDIMHEATEIAKLRLFLKLVAVVDVDRRAENLGLDPLPDIDFNIRCGNTLVGFANQKEIEDSFTNGDMFAIAETKSKIQTEIEIVSKTYQTFKKIQLTQQDDFEIFKQEKDKLSKRLSELNKLLNQILYPSTKKASYDKWLKTHQPFHWYSEFHDIIVGDGGFDVIIGNPPYVELRGVDYDLSQYNTKECGNLYAPVIERGLNVAHQKSRVGMIIQNSAFCTPRMLTFKDMFVDKSSVAWVSMFDDRPGRLFDNLEHIRVAICINEVGNGSKLSTTNYVKFISKCREHLFNGIFYGVNTSKASHIIAKKNTLIDNSILTKIMTNKPLSFAQSSNGLYGMYYHNAPQYFIRAMSNPPYFWNETDGEKVSTQIKSFLLDGTGDAALVGAIFNSNLFYWWFILFSDCRHLTNREINSFPFSPSDVSVINRQNLARLYNTLMVDYERHKNRKECNYKATGRVVYDEYFPKYSKSILNEIDCELAKHYGFTDEELDYIINYDIKYRMGGSLNEEEQA